MSKRITHEMFLKRLEGRPIEVLGTYQCSHTKIKFRCNIDGKTWNSDPSEVLRGRGCPYCAVRARSESNRKPNRVIEDHGDWVMIDISSPAHPDVTSKIDKDDFLGIPNRIYVGRNGYPSVFEEGKNILLHRLLFPDRKETDHINRDIFDNRRSNLRECTSSQNSMNKGISKSNSSGITGVSWHKATQKWRAWIMVSRKMNHLGVFKTKEEAVSARKDAEKLHYGEFTPTRGA